MESCIYKLKRSIDEKLRRFLIADKVLLLGILAISFFLFYPMSKINYKGLLLIVLIALVGFLVFVRIEIRMKREEVIHHYIDTYVVEIDELEKLLNTVQKRNDSSRGFIIKIIGFFGGILITIPSLLLSLYMGAFVVTSEESSQYRTIILGGGLEIVSMAIIVILFGIGSIYLLHSITTMLDIEFEKILLNIRFGSKKIFTQVQ
jgi:hypothetical protein